MQQFFGLKIKLFYPNTELKFPMVKFENSRTSIMFSRKNWKH
jgi:hypothetical protein